jgi:hypothetical protein
MVDARRGRRGAVGADDDRPFVEDQNFAGHARFPFNDCVPARDGLDAAEAGGKFEIVEAATPNGNSLKAVWLEHVQADISRLLVEMTMVKP